MIFVPFLKFGELLTLPVRDLSGFCVQPVNTGILSATGACFTAFLGVAFFAAGAGAEEAAALGAPKSEKPPFAGVAFFGAGAGAGAAFFGAGFFGAEKSERVGRAGDGFFTGADWAGATLAALGAGLPPPKKLNDWAFFGAGAGVGSGLGAGAGALNNDPRLSVGLGADGFG